VGEGVFRCIDMSSIESIRDQLAKAIRYAIQAKKPWKYVQSVELIVAFRGVDIRKHPEFRFRDAVPLPHGLGKEVKVCVVADGPMADQAKAAGAYRVVSRDEIAKYDKKAAKKLAQECDWVLIRADIMGIAGRILGPALGPRGKAPIPVPPNADITKLIEQYKNTTRLFSRDQPFVACKIGTENMSIEHLVDNAITVLNHIENKVKRPLLTFSKIYVKTTSSPAIEVI